MRSEIKTIAYPNGEIQRIQLVRWEDWGKLDFFRPEPSGKALDCFTDIYRNYLVPACPWIFGNMILFRLPEDVQVPSCPDTKICGRVGDRLTAAAAVMKGGVTIRKGRPQFRDDRLRAFWETLEARDCIRIVSGRLPITTIIPVDNTCGYLTKSAQDAALKVNASFFIMDRFDCATVYDPVGTAFGLCIRDGAVLSPPLYGREALLVKKGGRVTVETVDVRDLDIEIGGRIYRHGKNAVIDCRPERKNAPYPGKKLVITGCRVAAVWEKGRAPIPASGFVLRVAQDCTAAPGDRITYRGMEDVSFGIQVGNSILRNGEKTERFLSRFYNIRHLEPVPFPPSLYPMDFRRARAARIALGADKEGKPMLLWAEGAAKLGYVPGQGSCGASLSEMAELCTEVGMVSAVNLDGGGSAQILLENHRELQISDRSRENHSEAERPIPLGLILR